MKYLQMFFGLAALVEIGMICIPVLAFVPVIGPLIFGESFVQFGWMFIIMGGIAFLPTVLVIFILHFLMIKFPSEQTEIKKTFK